MTRYNSWLWFSGIVLTLLALAALLFASTGCGGAESVARQAVRSAAYVVQSLCAPSATVTECVDTLLERAEYLPEADAGRD